MDSMVSARVPTELRDQVNSELKKIGSTPTELINKAYEFFLETKMLPNPVKTLPPGHRRLNKAQRDELQKSLGDTTFKVPEAYFKGKSYKELLAESLKESYEALA